MKTWARIAKTAGLCVIILLICYIANDILNTNIRKYDSTDTKEADGTQVLFAGTSQGYNGINPLTIWDETGVESYNFCAAGQYIGTTYYVLKDVFDHQSPKAVVLDFESVTRPEDFLTISNKLYSLPMIAGLQNRYDMYKDVIGDSPIYFIPMVRYHNRWKEINRMDFRRDYDVLGAGRRIAVQTETDVLPTPLTDEKQSIGDRELAYLNQILELTRSKGCELILLDMPSYSSESMEAITNSVRDWAEANQLKVCEANRPESFTHMDLQPEDFTDEFHLNVYGQLKLSKYLGEWLIASGTAADHRGTPEGQAWDTRMQNCRYLTNDGELLMETDMAQYFELLEQGNYTVAISLVGNYKTDDEALLTVLESYGLSRQDYETGGAFVKAPDEAWIFNAQGSDSYRWALELGADDLVLRAFAPKDAAGVCQPRIEILFDRSDQSKLPHGINVLVYNHSTEGMIECVGFNAEDNYRIVR